MCLKTFIPISYYLSPMTLIDILIYKKFSKMFKNFNQFHNLKIKLYIKKMLSQCLNQMYSQASESKI